MASVASRNIFDLLGDNEDTETGVKEKEPSAKEQPVVVPKKVDRSRADPKEARIRHEYPQRGGHKPSASNRKNSEDTTRSGAPRDRNVGPRLSRREEGGGGGGGGGGGDYPTRNSRGARPSDRGRGGRGGRRGREHDRHSGTGRYDSEKKENQGWGSKTETWEGNNDTTAETPGWNAEANDSTNATAAWGNENDANAGGSWGDNANNTTTTEEKSDWNSGVPEEPSGTGDAWNAGGATADNKWEEQPVDNTPTWNGGDEGKNEDTAGGDSAPAPEPEEVVKTYDEYLAEKAQKSLDISLPESRKPNEGVDDSQWKDAVPLEKGEDEEFLFVGKEQSYRLKNKKSKAKNFLEIEQTFVERTAGGPRGRGRGRGGRGGGRGRDDRDRDGRDGRSNNYRDNNYDDNRRRGGGGGRSGVVNLDDQRAFPSLGASS